MITANDLREGMSIDIDNVLYTVEEFQHVKRGRGGAFVRTKLKNLRTSQSIKKIFQPNEKVKDAFIEEKSAQYLYREKDNFHFMDLETFEERVVFKENLDKKIDLFRENIKVTLRLYKGEVISVELPNFIELKVKKASPGVKGDTVGAATKMVVLETGYVLKVPLFVKEGDVVRIDTRSGEYISKR